MGFYATYAKDIEIDVLDRARKFFKLTHYRAWGFHWGYWFVGVARAVRKDLK